MTGSLAVTAVWVGLSIMGVTPEALPSHGAGEAPWANVTPEQEQKALELFELGNKKFHESSIQEAVGLYRQALEHWDHPGIHYNLAIALLALVRPLECHEHLEAAVRYGPGALDDPEKYRNATLIKKEVEAQLARLELSCDQEAARVTVDERADLFTCPSRYGEWVEPGVHFVRITRDGFFPTTKNLALKKGERRVVSLRLYTYEQWTRTRSRWPVWVPWVVMGSGVAVAATGVGIHLLANNTQQGVAFGSYAVGGAAVATGAVLLALNVPQPYLVDPEAGSPLTVAPFLAPGSGGLVFRVGF